MAAFNDGTGLEVSPGPRGHSVIGFRMSADGTTIYPQTDQPGELNGIRLPIGPQGPVGEYGDPGEARIRVDETIGFRLFLWDAATSGEYMVYGDTGTWTLPDGTTTVRRVGNTIETNAADPAALPTGFRPALAGSTGTYLTAEEWPLAVTGTITIPPTTHRGLEGYNAAQAQGYPGTAEQWMNMVYRVVLPPFGTTGQVLTRTDEGSAFRDLPRIGPGAWTNVTLASTWKASAAVLGFGVQTPQVRMNNGTVELIGDVTYTGPVTTAGVWGGTFVKIGNLPPAYAPEGHVDVPVRVFKGLDGGAGVPVMARVDIDSVGAIYLGAFAPPEWTSQAVPPGLPVKANITKVNFGSIGAYPLRNSSL